MKTAVIINPAAGGGRARRMLDLLDRQLSRAWGAVTMASTDSIANATELAGGFIRDGFGRIVVVGGDGTLNETVNGFFTFEGDY